MTDNMQIDDGRIIIDSKMWSTYNPDRAPKLEAIDNLPSGTQPIEDELSPWPPAAFIYNGNDLYASGHRPIPAMDHQVVSHLNRRPRPQNTQANSISTFTLNNDRREPRNLTTDQMALCTPMVRGYCLTSKKWGEF